MKNINVVIGEKVVLVEDGVNSGRRTSQKGLLPSYKEAIISKVGRKYYYVNLGYREVKFDIDTNHQVSEYCVDFSIHSSWEEYLECYNNRVASSKLKANYFPHYGDLNLTVDQCNRIISIIEEGK